MNMFTKLLETLGNNFWLIIILCLEVILAVWLLCFARGKKKNRAAEPDGHSVQDVLMCDLSKQDDEVCLLMRRSDKMPVYEMGDIEVCLAFLSHVCRRTLRALSRACTTAKAVATFGGTISRGTEKNR